MSYRVLMVGDDLELLDVRERTAPSSWRVTCSSSQGAMSVLRQERFALLIFCYAIAPATAKKLASAVRKDFPEILVLALYLPGWPTLELDEDARLDVTTGPAGLRQVGQELLTLGETAGRKMSKMSTQGKWHVRSQV